MFGWGKKKQGFEWHKYVRTTILVRREKRRQKVDDVRQAAAEQLVQAKVRGKQAAASGAQAAGAGLKSAGQRFIAASGAGASRLYAGLVSGLRMTGSAAWRGLTYIGGGLDAGLKRFLPAFGNALSVLATPRLTMPFAIIGVAAAAGAAARAVVVGFDGDALVATIVACVMLSLSVVSSVSGGGDGRGLSSRLGLSQISGGLPGRALVLVALFSVLVGGAWAGTRYVSLPNFNLALPAMVTAKPVKTLKGRAAVLSGDSLWLNGKFVKLDGIDAPESAQTCHRKGWRRRWHCGRAAKDALYKLTRRRTITCEVLSTDDGGREIARCSSARGDLAAEMVRKGLAFAEGGMFGSRYGDQQVAAKAAKLGVWRGDAIHPSAYRSEKWVAAQDKAPDGCPIKGRISRGARVYVLPWSPTYSRLKLSKARGERWFCSEAEARAAGWRPSEKS